MSHPGDGEGRGTGLSKRRGGGLSATVEKASFPEGFAPRPLAARPFSASHHQEEDRRRIGVLSAVTLALTGNPNPEGLQVCLASGLWPLGLWQEDNLASLLPYL